MKISTYASRLINLILPLLPASYRLPLIYWDHTNLGSSEPELKFMRKLVGSRDVAIDVGANKGIYSYAMAKIFSEVHAFEICPDHCKFLMAYRNPRITIHPHGLSNSWRKTKLYIPVLPNGWVLDGWSSLQSGNCPDASVQIEKFVEVRPLDSYGFKRCSFLKVDVEGHELEMLEGAVELLTTSRPRILIEVREKNHFAVDSFLRQLDYRQIPLREILGSDGAEGNFFYIPI